MQNEDDLTGRRSTEESAVKTTEVAMMRALGWSELLWLIVIQPLAGAKQKANCQITKIPNQISQKNMEIQTNEEQSEGGCVYVVLTDITSWTPLTGLSKHAVRLKWK